jgi:hypothetical protein
MIWSFVIGADYIPIRYNPLREGMPTGSMVVLSCEDDEDFDVMSSALQFRGVCRQIYYEVGLSNYSKNVFVLDWSFLRYKDKPQFLPLAMRQGVTSVALDFLLDIMFSIEEDYPQKSVRNFFPNCRSIEVLDNNGWLFECANEIPTADELFTQKERRAWVVEKLREKEGDDIEIKLSDEVVYICQY